LSGRQLDEATEFLVLTRWQSIEAIRGFAGSDISKAIVEPGAVAALLDFDASVQHYEVIEESARPGKRGRLTRSAVRLAFDEGSQPGQSLVPLT